MFAKGRSNYRAYIEDTGDYLSYLLNMYPTLLNTWIKEKEQECRKVAKDSSDGDVEVENSIYNSLCQEFESFGETEILFYDAVFIMVYSYYESVIMMLSQKYNCCNRPSAICECNGIQLSDMAKSNASFLHDSIRVLRNQFCHNWLGTIGAVKDNDKKTVSDLIKQYPNTISRNDISIHVINGPFIFEVLNKEIIVIEELINKLNI